MIYLAPIAVASTSRQLAALRRAERDWQRHAAFDLWPGGNPWAGMRDEAAARYDRIRSEIDAMPGRMRSLAGCLADAQQGR